MTDIVERLRDIAFAVGRTAGFDAQVCPEAADQIERLRAALEILQIAVDREGWPAGWGQIRKQVQDVLSQDIDQRSR